MKKKVGRNDPCPCGSGLKYKKCCLPKGKKTEFFEVEDESNGEKPNIEELKKKKDIDGLIKAMGNEDFDIRTYASVALVDMGDKPLKPLIKALEEKNDTLRWGAIFVLSKMGKTAVEPLEKLLDHKDQDVREYARMALDMIYEEGKVFFDEMEEQIAKRFEDDPEFAKQVLKLFGGKKAEEEEDKPKEEDGGEIEEEDKGSE